MTQFLQTPHGRLSWARLSSLACLVAAIALAVAKRPDGTINAFLVASVSFYSSSKISEAIGGKKCE